MRLHLLLLLLLLFPSLLSVCRAVPRFLEAKQTGADFWAPLVIAHRGSGLFPDESRRAYEEGGKEGADYLECDVQVTKDDVLICFHDPHLTALNSDAPTRWPGKNTTHIPDGTKDGQGSVMNGWFFVDYTWDQLKDVPCKQEKLERDQRWDKEKVLKLDEYLDIVDKYDAGAYIECKHATFYKRYAKKDAAKMLVAFLKKRKFDSPPILQSFEIKDMEYFLKATDYPVVLLVDFLETNALGYAYGRDETDHVTIEPISLNTLPANSSHLEGLGPSKKMILTHPEIVKQIQDKDLDVHVWTFQNEPSFRRPDGSIRRNIDLKFQQDPYKELDYFLGDMKVDGIFTDHAGTAIRYIETMYALHKKSQQMDSAETLAATVALGLAFATGALRAGW